MSQESTTPDLVELVRGILAAANRKDWDAILDFYASDAVWEMSDGMGTFEGRSAIRGFWEEWWSSYGRLAIDAHEVLDLGSGIVIATFLFGGPPKGSTAEIQTQVALVYEWVNGAVVHVTSYFNVVEARAAAERLAESRA